MKEALVKLTRITAVTVLVLLAVAFGGVVRPPGAHGSTETSGGSMTVSGTGSATVTPDRAGLDFGVVTNAKTATAAFNTNSAAVSRLLAALVAAGVARADMQTADVSLMPRTNESGDTILGYTASNTISVELKQLTRAGAVIDSAVAAGADTVSGPNLFAADQAAAYRTALAAAVAGARDKAQSLAASAHVTLGRLTGVNESGEPPVPLAAQDAAKAGFVQIEPGTQDVSATVTLTFALD
jgi:uncharacterized protein YggE